MGILSIRYTTMELFQRRHWGTLPRRDRAIVNRIYSGTVFKGGIGRHFREEIGRLSIGSTVELFSKVALATLLIRDRAIVNQIYSGTVFKGGIGRHFREEIGRLSIGSTVELFSKAALGDTFEKR